MSKRPYSIHISIYPSIITYLKIEKMYSVDAWGKQSTEAEFSALQEHSNFFKKKYKE